MKYNMNWQQFAQGDHGRQRGDAVSGLGHAGEAGSRFTTGSAAPALRARHP